MKDIKNLKIIQAFSYFYSAFAAGWFITMVLFQDVWFVSKVFFSFVFLCYLFHHYLLFTDWRKKRITN